MHEALRKLSYYDWMRLFDRTHDVGEACAIFDQKSLQRWLGDQSIDRDLPHSGVVGWHFPPRDPQHFTLFFAAWLHAFYRIEAPLTDAAQRCVRDFLTRFASPLFGRTTMDKAENTRGFYEQLTCRGNDYPLRGRRVWWFDASTRRLYVDGLTQLYVGQGSDEPAARANLAAKVDRDFQALFGTRPPDRDEQQDRIWQLLCQIIDLDAYRDQKPLRLVRVGQIRKRTANARIVGWEEDRRAQKVPLERAVPEFADIPNGVRFEATMRCHSRTDEVQMIEHVRYLDDHEITPREIQDFWDHLS
jgi:hypothetical protein